MLISPAEGMAGCMAGRYAVGVKTEDILKLEAERRAIREQFGPLIVVASERTARIRDRALIRLEDRCSGAWPTSPPPPPFP